MNSLFTSRIIGQRGLTLTELMVAVSVMGLLIAISAPAFGRFMDSWKLNGEVSQFATQLRVARNVAVTKNIEVIFVFDTNEGEYFYIEDQNGDGDANEGELLSANHELATGISFGEVTTPQSWITFGPKGNTIDGGRINFTNLHNGFKTVRVFNGTGNVSVE